MKRLTKFFARLYPATWRNRYEAEFAALLEDVRPGWRTSLDILKGAVGMQLRTARFGKIVPITGLIGLVLGLGAWVVLPDQYASTVILKIQHLPGANGQLPTGAVSDQMNAWAEAVFTRQSFVELIERLRLYPAKQGKVPLEDIVTEMKENITVQPAGKDAVFIQFRYFDDPCHNVSLAS